MTKQEIAEKEIEAFKWMKNKGYDRLACKDIAPILVKYAIEQLSIPLVVDSSKRCPKCQKCQNQWYV